MVNVIRAKHRLPANWVFRCGQCTISFPKTRGIEWRRVLPWCHVQSSSSAPLKLPATLSSVSSGAVGTGRLLIHRAALVRVALFCDHRKAFSCWYPIAWLLVTLTPNNSAGTSSPRGAPSITPHSRCFSFGQLVEAQAFGPVVYGDCWSEKRSAELCRME